MRDIPIVLAAVVLSATVPCAAVAQLGLPDPAFDSDGIVVTDLDERDRAMGVLVQADGSLAVAGQAFGASASTRDGVVARYGTDGSLLGAQTYTEVPFGCLAPDAFNALTRQEDGLLIAAGYSQNGCGGSDQRDFWVKRLATSGPSSQRFATPMFQANYDEARAVVVQSDGKVVAAGVTAASAATSSWDFAIARWNADGTLDSASFGAGGEVIVDVSGERDWAAAIAVQPDGKIVIAGYVRETERDIAVVRLLPEGTPDATFGGDGIVTTDFAGDDDGANALAVLADGSILVAGWRTGADGTDQEAVIVRYEGDGDVDTTFGASGFAVVDLGILPAVAHALLVQHDGKIVLGGHTETGAGGVESRDVFVARLLADGSPDTSFAGDGAHVQDLAGGLDDRATSLALQPEDGNIVLAAYTVDASGPTNLEDLSLLRVVGDASLLVFRDGFESGDVGAWGP